MTLTADPTTPTTANSSEAFVAPGQPGSVVEVKPRYDNFIGGKWVAPVKGQYMANVSPVNGKPFCEVATFDSLRMWSWPSTPPMRPRTPGARHR